MFMFICNAFNDPGDPWYYVIGVLFLVLVFGALAVYLYFSKKKETKNKETTEQSTPENGDGGESGGDITVADDKTVDKTEQTEKSE